MSSTSFGWGKGKGRNITTAGWHSAADLSNIKRIVGLVVKTPKLAQIMLNIHELISATVPSQIFS